MARLERHELEDRGLEEEREERRTRSEGAKPAMDYSVLTDALAGERQEGGYHSNVVASQQASSWSSSRTPFDPTTSFDPPASLLVEAAERQAILLQELARRGMAFPAAVASSHGELPYSLCSNELPSSESRMRINQTTLKPRTANDQALRDSRDCQWPLMRFFDNGAEVNTQGQPLSQLNGNPVQLRDEKPADERRKDLCKREGNFLSSSSTPIDSSFKTEQQQPTSVPPCLSPNLSPKPKELPSSEPSKPVHHAFVDGMILKRQGASSLKAKSVMKAKANKSPSKDVHEVETKKGTPPYQKGPHRDLLDDLFSE